MKKSFAAALPLAFPLLLTILNVSAPKANAPTIPNAPQALRIQYASLVDQPASLLPQHSIVLAVEDEDTLDAVFREGGLSSGDSAALNREFGRFLDLRRLRPGHLIRFHYDESNAVDSVEMKVSGWGEIDAIRQGEAFNVTAHQVTTREIETTIAANIDSSLYEALRMEGESPQLVQQLVDVFQWDIDFFALQRGDSFSVIVDKKFAGSEPAGYGPILAARFTHNGQIYEAFRHETPDGRAGYYARNGSPLRKQFLRAPLQFTRITSHFSNRRFHPLLHYFRPHHGVDYGAPTGTPVMTTADGVVVEAHYKGGEGNFVRIRHSSRVDTYYLHLSRYAKGIRPGKRVVQGEVIGYVGMTGLATAPHLDYRVNDNGTWLDPLKLKSITPDPLRGAVVADFRARVNRFSPRLAAGTQQVADRQPRRRALF